MHVIRDLEEVPRGVYCGSLGAWLSPEPGDTRVGAWWNVAIRTVTFARGIARVHVGAGIVLDSDPEREFHETTLKARRMLEALA
jgi:para-aminobenzoate synthetase component 1